MNSAKICFLKDFDKQLIGLKKDDKKNVTAFLPQNHPKKDLANKKTIFKCEIKNMKSVIKNKITMSLQKTRRKRFI